MVDNEVGTVKMNEDYNIAILKRGNTEIYPMPAFSGLVVSNLAASGAWYNKLGFITLIAMPGMTHVRWIKFADILLYQAQPGEAVGQQGGVRLNFNLWPEDIAIHELAAQWQAAGVEIVEGPVARPWNTTEVIVRDPDGYRLTFTQVDYSRLNQNPAFRQRIEQGYKEATGQP